MSASIREQIREYYRFQFGIREALSFIFALQKALWLSENIVHLHCVLRREKHMGALLYLIGVLEEQNYPRKRVWLVANLLEYQMSFAYCFLAKSGMRPNKD